MHGCIYIPQGILQGPEDPRQPSDVSAATSPPLPCILCSLLVNTARVQDAGCRLPTRVYYTLTLFSNRNRRHLCAVCVLGEVGFSHT